MACIDNVAQYNRKKKETTNLLNFYQKKMVRLIQKNLTVLITQIKLVKAIKF